MKSTHTFTDQLNRQVTVPFPPQRIISIVPSQTELLAHLGLDKEVVGITKFCIHPDKWFRSKTRVGGTKQLNLAKIKELHPDLIIGNKEENEQGQMEELMKQYPVWMSDVRSLDDALEMIKRVGEMTDRKISANCLLGEIEKSFSTLKPVHPKLKAAYFIWRQPYMVVGGNTFVNDILRRCGFENVFENHAARYAEINSDDLVAANPDVILLSSEPFPFKEKHVAELKSICPTSKIMLVDGEMFSWYGSRLLQAVNYFRALINNFSNEED